MNLDKRFAVLWKDIKARGDPSVELSSLRQRYVHPPRAYHNLDHVVDCLTEYDSIRDKIPSQNSSCAIEFALWYHDIIYDTHAQSNELKSADLAFDVCTRRSVAPSFAHNVRACILATMHNKTPQTQEEKFVVDIDLSILGANDERFDEYEGQIRQEYSWVSGQDFKDGRAQILQGFLDRYTIYFTDVMKEKYEEQARKNLQRSIAALRGA